MSEKDKTGFVNVGGGAPYITNQTESAIAGLNAGSRYINIQFDPDLLHSVHNEWDIIGMPTIAQPIPSGIHPKPRNNPVSIGKMIIAKGKISSFVTIEEYEGQPPTTSFTKEDRDRMMRIEKKLAELEQKLNLLLK
jgi:hypothetical protein